MKKVVIFLIILIVGVFSIYLFNKIKEKNVEEKEATNILKKNEQKVNEEQKVNKEENYEEMVINLKQEYNNDDVVGIFSIPGADYSVPLLQGEDNDYYLKHTPDKKYNQNGSIYLDYRVDIDSSKKQLIYGHNSDKIEMPFDILENYYDKNYYEEHKYIEIISTKQKKKYEIFSVYVEPEDFTYMKIEFGSDEEYLNHIKKLQSKSMHEINVDLSEKDEILVMQTCSEHPDYKKYSKKYLLIISRRVL